MFRLNSRIIIKLMIMDLGLCDSFDEQDIEELEGELEGLEGPSLKYFEYWEQQQPIIPFTSIDLIKSFLNGQSKDIKLVGSQESSPFRAFFYILLLIGVEERRNYPHLNTLIRQQFYKPDIFRQPDHPQQSSTSGQSRAMLQKCLQYFEEVGEGVRAEDYILREPLFEHACLTMLKNSLQASEKEKVIEQLARKFNIDMRVVKSEDTGECYELGVSKNYHIIREHSYYFLAICESKEDLNLSKFELESIRSGESGLQLVIPEASDKSTPKFKNSEAKFRKKSHKNSFGGEFDLVQYRDLLHIQTQKISNNNAKVLSEYDVNDIESCAEQLEQKSLLKKNSFQEIIDSQKIEMKGSTTLQPKQLVSERRFDRKLSSSEIIEYNFSNFQKKEESPSKLHPPQLQEGHPLKSPSYNSLVMVKEDPGQLNSPFTARMRTSLIQNKELERIDELQSSQKQSHPDQEDSEASLNEQRMEASSYQSQVKMKDRKYSYFTQQMASNNSKKAKEIESSNYVFRIPKNIHKNSEVILPNGEEHEIIRKRFQQNPLRFSQLGGPSENSVHESEPQLRKHRLQRQMRLASGTYSYQIRFQPMHWYKKEVIYHFDNGQRELQVFERTFNRPDHKTAGNPPEPVTTFPPPSREVHFAEQQSLIRDSFGSGNTLPSNIRMKDSNNFSSSLLPSQTAHTINHYQLNETSFLKNRIQSMANLDPQENERDDSKSIQFSTCRSLRNITSPTKIRFSYLPPTQAALRAPSLNQPSTAAHSIQFRQSTNMPTLSNHPIQYHLQSFSADYQTLKGVNSTLNGPGSSLEMRFIRR